MHLKCKYNFWMHLIEFKIQIHLILIVFQIVVLRNKKFAEL